MNVKFRKIEVAAETADLLEARASARGVTVSDLIADLAGAVETLPASLAQARAMNSGPWSPEILAEDARRLAAYKETGEAVPWADVRAWLRSWGTKDELPPPTPRKS
jgi:predicted transcriptional regulator